MKRLIRDYAFLFLLSGSIIALDQFTKFIIRSTLEIGQVWSQLPWLTPYARIVHWYNTGVAFGLFQGKGDVFLILAVLVAGAIILYFPRVPAEDWTLRLAMGLQLGGAIGNLIDRVTIGHVTDFISVGSFPVFNIADASITIGVIVLLIGVYLQDRKDKRLATEKDATADGPVV